MASPILSGALVSGGAQLNWGSNVLAADYELEYSDNAGSTWADLAVGVALSHLDSSLGEGDTRLYRVRARNAVENSAWSNQVSVTWLVFGSPTAAASAATRAHQVTVSFAPISGATGYEVEFSTSNSFSTWYRISSFGGLYALSVTPTSISGMLPDQALGSPAGNRAVFVRARAINASGAGAWGPTTSVLTAPRAPTNGTWSGYTASWTAGAGASRYMLYIGGVFATTVTGTSADLSTYASQLDAGQPLVIYGLRDSDGLESPPLNVGVPS